MPRLVIVEPAYASTVGHHGEVNRPLLAALAEAAAQHPVAADEEEARKEAILRLKGFPVVGSMENPPTNSVAVEQARGGLG
jgi:hypothetical protein